jgi:cytochrome c peroxidase
MGRRQILTLLTLAMAFAFFGGNLARGAAHVGENRPVEVEPAAAPEREPYKASYRRPDTIPFPAGNPYTPPKASLGRQLFYDTRLSGSGALSCASCHNPGFAYGDGLEKGIGNRMKVMDRRSPSIINSAWGTLFFWDGRASSLEEQALGPIAAPSIMNQPLDRATQVLSNVGEYKALFSMAFPGQAISSTTIASAIATYERTIVSNRAPFDEWIDGDATAISDAAKRGFVLFNTTARCASCHSG